MTAYVLGYARTSTRQQDLTMQKIAMEKAGCTKIFEEQESGAKRNRPVLNAVLEQLREGDTLMVWKFDRLARSALHLIQIAEDLKRRGTHLVSITDKVDTSTPIGNAMFQLCGMMAELERNLIEERRIAGIEKAKMKGVKFGRKRLSDDASSAGKSGDLAKALRAIEKGEMSQSRAARHFKIARSTIKRHLEEFRADNSLPTVSNVVSLPISAFRSGSEG